MLTLRKLTYEVTDNGDNFWTHLKLDTKRMSFYFADFWWSNRILVDKPWVGEINNENFKIIGARAGLLKINPSTILVTGRISRLQSKTQIRLSFGLPGYLILILMFEALFLTLVFLDPPPTDFLFVDIWGLLALVLVQLLFILFDLSKTEDRIVKYFEADESNVPQHRV